MRFSFYNILIQCIYSVLFIGFLFQVIGFLFLVIGFLFLVIGFLFLVVKKP